MPAGMTRREYARLIVLLAALVGPALASSYLDALDAGDPLTLAGTLSAIGGCLIIAWYRSRGRR